MVVSKKKSAKGGKLKESEKIRATKVAFSNPQMIEISLYEIQSFLIAENIAKLVLTIGSLLIGGIISAIFSNITISAPIMIISILIFVSGLISDVYITWTKFNELKNKGAKEWQ